MRPSRWMVLTVAYLFYLSTLAFSAEVRKATRQDIEWTTGDRPSTDCTVTSAGGHVGNVLDNTYYLSSPYVDVRAYSTFALALTAAANKTLLVSSAVTIADNTTIPDNVAVFVVQGGSFAVSTGVTLTINGSFLAGFYQVFSGSGTVLFGNGDGTGARNPVAYPQWWGAKPDGATDCGPGIQKAINSWAGRIFLSYGQWGIGTPVTITAQNWNIEGTSRVYTDIFPLAADISVAGGPNALFIINVNLANGMMSGIRWRNSYASGPWAIWAVEGGGSQSLFNTVIKDMWVSMGAADGFFHGDLLECQVSNFQWDGITLGFDLLSSLSQGNIFDIHAYALATSEFIKSVGGANNTVTGIETGNHYFQPLISVTNGSKWDISHINYNADPTLGGQVHAGAFLFDNCTNMQVSNFMINRVSGYMGGFRILSSEVKISHGTITGANRDYTYTAYYLIYGGINIGGAGNKVEIDDVTFDGGTDQLILDGPGGDISVKNSTFKKSTRGAIASTASSSANITLEGNTFINASYDNVLVDNVPIIELWTSGIAKVKNNTIGILDNAATSTPSARMKFKGSGQLILGGNNYPGTVQEFDNNSTQTPITYTGPNVGGTSNRSAAGAPSPAPLFIGENYLNTTDNTWYRAHCVADNTCWNALN